VQSINIYFHHRRLEPLLSLSHNIYCILPVKELYDESIASAKSEPLPSREYFPRRYAWHVRNLPAGFPCLGSRGTDKNLFNALCQGIGSLHVAAVKRTNQYLTVRLTFTPRTTCWRGRTPLIYSNHHSMNTNNIGSVVIF
jgi:hypothetical protein